MGSRKHEKRPCGTPGAVYETTFTDDTVLANVKLPVAIFGAMDDETREALIHHIHIGMVDAIEPIYKRLWEKHFAGVIVEGDDQPLPPSWYDLYELWSNGFGTGSFRQKSPATEKGACSYVKTATNESSFAQESGQPHPICMRCGAFGHHVSDCDQ